MMERFPPILSNPIHAFSILAGYWGARGSLEERGKVIKTAEQRHGENPPLSDGRMGTLPCSRSRNISTLQQRLSPYGGTHTPAVNPFPGGA